jgi:hypothetical protein
MYGHCCLILLKWGPYAVAHCSTLLSLHQTAILRHDVIGQEVLLNLLLRNYLSYGLYDQVRAQFHLCDGLLVLVTCQVLTDD